MLFAGAAMAQSIFVDQDLSVSPVITLAQAGTVKAPADKCENCSHKHHQGMAEKEMSPEMKEKMDKAKANAKYFGGFGGAGANYLMIDMDAFDPVTDDRDIDNFDPIITVGGLGGLILRGMFSVLIAYLAAASHPPSATGCELPLMRWLAASGERRVIIGSPFWDTRSWPNPAHSSPAPWPGSA